MNRLAARAIAGPSGLVLPGLALLCGVFLVPLAWFLVQTLGELGSWREILSEARLVLSAPTLLRAAGLTLAISAVVTVLCILLAFPMAAVLTRTSGVAFKLLIATIIVPYFTSAIVRTYAWMVLLGRSGVVNQFLLDAGLTTAPLKLMYNNVAVVTGMTYVLMPYTVMTLYAAMRSVDRRLLQAAEGMGAGPFYIFTRVFVPLIMPGIVSGSLIVFILSLGFFITPALMGDPGTVTLTMMIEQEVEMNLNWPVAAIISLALLAVTLVLYRIYYSAAKLRRMLP